MARPSLINRIAVTLIPTQACLDWINSCDDDKMTLDKIQSDPTTFLLPEGRDEPEKRIRRHYRSMFVEELNSWYTDENMWPKDLSFRMFKTFFTIHVASMVLDLGVGEIVKEED
jgi:hypothetical protein